MPRRTKSMIEVKVLRRKSRFKSFGNGTKLRGDYGELMEAKLY